MRLEPTELHNFTQYGGGGGDSIDFYGLRGAYFVEYWAEWEGMLQVEYFDNYEEALDLVWVWAKLYGWHSVWEGGVRVTEEGFKVPYQIYPPISRQEKI
jgi:hypothetical protein